MLVELRVLALLVGGGDERVALVLQPFADSQLVLSGAQQLGLLFGVDAALCHHVSMQPYLFAPN